MDVGAVDVLAIVLVEVERVIAVAESIEVEREALLRDKIFGIIIEF